MESVSEYRRNKIAQLIASRENFKVGELAKIFNVSTETIRKDLIFLDRQGIVKKSHGGAIINEVNLKSSVEKPLSIKELENKEYKKRIAMHALSLIPPNASFFIDSGTTNYFLAELLAHEKGMNIFTNSIPVVNMLAESANNIYILGGKLKEQSHCIVGNWTLQLLENIQPDIAFLGSDAFKNSLGPCTASFDESGIKSKIVEKSEKAIVLADSSKFSNSGLFTFCEWNKIDLLITDTRVSKKELKQLNQVTHVITV
ncbi:DeoR/GlpR family DNA-binding transcription regulator [Orbus sturtevantii]|uniref:DeoR/GlpR family DNA-binding transcription regulator n=1 Tax=Orbus sturtevantii TaxID=3074109 RepID=UPI00370D5410